MALFLHNCDARRAHKHDLRPYSSLHYFVDVLAEEDVIAHPAGGSLVVSQSQVLDRGLCLCLLLVLTSSCIFVFVCSNTTIIKSQWVI